MAEPTALNTEMQFDEGVDTLAFANADLPAKPRFSPNTEIVSAHENGLQNHSYSPPQTPGDLLPGAIRNDIYNDNGLGVMDGSGTVTPAFEGTRVKDLLPADPEQAGFIKSLGAHYLLNSAFVANIRQKPITGDTMQGPPSTDYRKKAEDAGIVGPDSSRFELVHNDNDYNAIMRNLYKERQAKEIVSAGGWRSGAAGLVQGVFTPENVPLAIPIIGEEMLAARGMGTAGRIAIRGGEGAAGGFTTGLANAYALKYSTQREKTHGDVWDEAKDAALIGTVLAVGGGIAKETFAHPVVAAVRQAVGQDVMNNLNNIGGSVGAALAPVRERFPMGTTGSGKIDKITGKAFNATAKITSNPVNQIFAGEHTSNAIKGGAEALADVQNPLSELVPDFGNPDLLPETTDALNARRTQYTQDAAPLFKEDVTPEAREAGLARLQTEYAKDEADILAKDPNANKPTEPQYQSAAVNVGGSVEGRSNLTTRQIKIAANTVINDAFTKYRYAGQKTPWFANTRAAFQDLGNRGNPDAPLSLSEFDSAIGKAMHQGDAHENEAVQGAAQELRPLLDRVRKTAQEAGLLPEDISAPDNATSYFPIIYDPIAVLRNPKKFEDIQYNAINAQMVQYRDLQEAIRGHLDEIDTLVKEHAKLTKATAGKEETLNNLAVRLQERTAFANKISSKDKSIRERLDFEGNRLKELGKALSEGDNAQIVNTLKDFVETGDIAPEQAALITEKYGRLIDALDKPDSFKTVAHLFDYYSAHLTDKKANPVPVPERGAGIVATLKNHLIKGTRPESNVSLNPITKYLQNNKVRPESTLGYQLAEAGITPKNRPAIFDEKGKLQKFNYTDFARDMQRDGYGFVPNPGDFIEALRAEGKKRPPVKTELREKSEREAGNVGDILDNLKERLELQGQDLNTLKSEDVKAALVAEYGEIPPLADSPHEKLNILMNNIDKFEKEIISTLGKFDKKIKETKAGKTVVNDIKPTASEERQLHGLQITQKEMRRLFDEVYGKASSGEARYLAKDYEVAIQKALAEQHVGRISELRDEVERIVGDTDPATVTRARRRTAEMLKDLQDRRTAEAEARAAAADERAPKAAGKIAERADKTRAEAAQNAQDRLQARSDRLKQAGKDDLTPEKKAELIKAYLKQSEKTAIRIEAKARTAHERISAQAEDLRSGEKSIKLFDDEFEDLMKYIMQKRTDLDESELRKIAGDITQNIASQHQLIKGSSDYLDRPTTIAPKSQTEKPGALKSRTLLPHVDELLDNGFLNTKASEIIKNHTDSMIPFAEYTKFLNETRDDYDLTHLQRKGREDYDLARSRATTPQELEAINDKNIKDQENLLIIRDRILGKYGHPPDPNDVFFYKIPSALLRYNILKLAGAVIGNAGDIAKISLTGNRAIRTSVQSLFTRLTQSGAAADLLRQDAESLRHLGIITNVALGRSSLYMQDVLRRSAQDRVSKGVDYTVNKTMALSYFAQFQDGIKTVYAQSLGHNVIRNIDMALKGTATEKQIHILNDLGIAPHHYDAIMREYAAHGQNYGGTHYLNLGAWTDAEARNTVLLSLQKDIDRAFDERTANRSHFFEQNVWMRLLGQFKHFTISNTNTFLMRGLQERDMRFAVTATHMLGWGLAVEFIKNAQYGRPTDTNPTALLVAAIDRSGLLGLPWEANNIAEKVFHAGVRPALGIDNAGGSKNRNLSNWSAVFGPGYGTITSATSAFADGIHGDLNKKDVNFLFGMVPGSSLPWGPVQLKGAAINAVNDQ